MTRFSSFFRTASFTFLVALVGATTMGCDGGSDDMSTSVQALSAQVNAASPAVSYDVRVRVFAPEASAVHRFNRVHSQSARAATIDAGFDISASAASPMDSVRLQETFAATVEALANNEYLGERDVQDAVNQPFFTTFPLAACGGNFPCDLLVRIDVEGFDLPQDGALNLAGDAWVASDYYDVEIVDITSFPTY